LSKLHFKTLTAKARIMGDVGDYWRDVKEWRKSQGLSTSRRKPPARFVKFGKAQEALGFRQCSEWHWQIIVNGKPLDYWPSKNKWRHNDQTTTGKYDDLVAFINHNT
jgi:hypothetical protein